MHILLRIWDEARQFLLLLLLTVFLRKQRLVDVLATLLDLFREPKAVCAALLATLHTYPFVEEAPLLTVGRRRRVTFEEWAASSSRFCH